MRIVGIDVTVGIVVLLILAGGAALIITDTSGCKHLRTPDRHLYKQFVPNCPQARRLRPQYFFSLVRPGDRTSLRALCLCSFSAHSLLILCFFLRVVFVSFSSRLRD